MPYQRFQRFDCFRKVTYKDHVHHLKCFEIEWRIVQKIKNEKKKKKEIYQNY